MINGVYSGKRTVKCWDYCLKANSSSVCESVSPVHESAKYIVPQRVTTLNIFNTCKTPKGAQQAINLVDQNWLET